MSLNSVNARINKSQVLSAAFEIYQFTSSHVVVRVFVALQSPPQVRLIW